MDEMPDRKSAGYYYGENRDMTERKIIGIDIKIEYSGGETAEGHLSPNGVHVNKRLPLAVAETLNLMRAPIADQFKPYGSKRDAARQG